MEKRRWLASEWGVSHNNRRAKFYRLTPKGVTALEKAGSSWAIYSSAVTRVLSATEADA